VESITYGGSYDVPGLSFAPGIDFSTSISDGRTSATITPAGISLSALPGEAHVFTTHTEVYDLGDYWDYSKKYYSRHARNIYSSALETGKAAYNTSAKYVQSAYDRVASGLKNAGNKISNFIKGK